MDRLHNVGLACGERILGCLFVWWVGDGVYREVAVEVFLLVGGFVMLDLAINGH